MATIIDPKAVRYAREKFRPMAEEALRLYRTIAEFQAKIVEFETITSGNAGSDIIGDGNQNLDPVYPRTKQNVAELKDVIENLKTAFETSDRLARLSGWSANSLPLY